MLEKPEGLVGETIFAVRSAVVGKTKKAYFNPKDETLLRTTVNIRLERCNWPIQTVDHAHVPDYIEFGITTQVWNISKTRVLFPSPGLQQVDEVDPLLGRAKFDQLKTLATWHGNSMQQACIHQHERTSLSNLPAPCAVSGYVYGTGWLLRPLPEDFLPRLRKVFADADPDCVYDAEE